MKNILMLSVMLCGVMVAQDENNLYGASSVAVVFDVESPYIEITLSDNVTPGTKIPVQLGAIGSISATGMKDGVEDRWPGASDPIPDVMYSEVSVTDKKKVRIEISQADSKSLWTFVSRNMQGNIRMKYWYNAPMLVGESVDSLTIEGDSRVIRELNGMKVLMLDGRLQKIRHPTVNHK